MQVFEQISFINLSEFEAAIAECVDNPDLIGEDDDPAYITPVHQEKTVAAAAIAQTSDNPDLIGEDDDPAYVPPCMRGNSLDFLSALSPLADMILAKDVMEFSDGLEELQARIIEICYELSLLIVNDGFETPKLETLQSDLNSAMTAIAPNSSKEPTDFPMTDKSVEKLPVPEKSSITSDIEEQKSTKNEPSSTPDPPQTLKSGYIEEKTIRKNGKVVGIYLYERWREGGKLKSKYLGSKAKLINR